MLKQFLNTGSLKSLMLFDAESEAGAAEEKARQETKKIEAEIPVRPVATDFFSTLARGFARVTGIEKEPPRGYQWVI